MNVSGVVANTPMPGMAAYSASKAGVAAAMEAVRRELRRSKVHVIDARPPHTKTGLADHPLAGTAPRMPEGMTPRAVAERIVVAVERGESVVTADQFRELTLETGSTPVATWWGNVGPIPGEGNVTTLQHRGTGTATTTGRTVAEYLQPIVHRSSAGHPRSRSAFWDGSHVGAGGPGRIVVRGPDALRRLSGHRVSSASHGPSSPAISTPPAILADMLRIMRAALTRPGPLPSRRPCRAIRAGRWRWA